MDVRRVVAVALRSLRHRPAYSAMVVICLAAGLAVSMGAAGVAKQTLVDPLPYQDAEQVLIFHREGTGGGRGGLSFGAFGDVASSGLVDGAAAVVLPTFDQAVVLTEGPTPERVAGLRVTSSFFDVLGVSPLLGQGFAGDPAAGPEVMITHNAWQARFGGGQIVGDRIRVNGDLATVAGVLPEGFRYPLDPDAELFVKMVPGAAQAADREARVLQVVARYRGTAQELRLRLGQLDEAVIQAAPWSEAPPLRVASIRDYFFGDLRRPLLFLAAAGVLTLLVAALNVALLVMARAQERKGVDAIRRALGARWAHLVQGPLAEALVLGLVASVLGLAGAVTLVGVLAVTSGGVVPTQRLLLDAPLVLAAVLLGLATTSGAALFVTSRQGRADLAALRARGTGQDRRAGRRWNLLVGAQTGLVVFLLIAAGLTGRSLAQLLAVDPGFQPGDRWALQVELPPERYDTQRQIGDFLYSTERALRARPGIEGAGFVTNLPLTAGWSGQLAIRDRGPSAEGSTPVNWEMASAGYFDAMGIPLLEGRVFTETDDEDAPLVTVVNEALAQLYWPQGTAIGARISGTGERGPWAEIVGVVGDVRQDGLAVGVEPMMYVPFTQVFANPVGQLVVQGSSGSGPATAQVARAALLEQEPRAIVSGPRPLTDLIRRDTGTTRLQGSLLALFGITALLLGLAGTVGVVSYFVSQKTREIGVRLALGATRPGVIRQTIAEGLLPVVGGTVVGLLLALVAGSHLRLLLFRTSPADPVVLLGIPPVLIGAAAIALLVPALRAARTDPARVLRSE